MFGRWWHDEESGESGGDTDCPECCFRGKETDDCLTCLGTGFAYYCGRAEDVVGREEWGDVQLATFLMHSSIERGWTPQEFLRQPAKWVSGYFAVASTLLAEMRRARAPEVNHHGEFSSGRNQT